MKPIELTLRTATDKILSEFDTLADHVRVNLLGVPSEQGNGPGKKKADTSKMKGTKQMVYMINDFPYFVEPGIEHGIVWSSGKLCKDEMLALLEEKLPGKEKLYFINPPSLQSIAEVEHAHVFSRDKPTGCTLAL